jgi:hypothetical protein
MNNRTLSLTSKFIMGASPHPQTEQLLRISSGIAPGTELSMMVFEVEIDHTIRYCCWSGGKMIPPPSGQGATLPHLTPAGQAACEALLRLPHLYGPDGEFLYALVFHEVRMGKTPILDKVMAGFRRTADVNAVICFVGDLAGELDGQVSKTMNISGAIEVGKIAGMARRVVP